MRMALPLGLLLVMIGCHEKTTLPTGPSVGSETHWLESCASDTECGDVNACVCGICTAPCAGEVCGDGATCVTGGEAGAALCGAVPASADGVCAATCDGGCPAGQACTGAGVCASLRSAGDPGPTLQATSEFETHPVDILFVVDDTATMCQEQASLTAAFAAAVERFADVDYRMAVITTDMVADGARGAFRSAAIAPEPDPGCVDDGGAPWVPATDGCDGFLGQIDDPRLIRPGVVDDDADLAKWFRCLATAGTAGDPYPAGLGAAWRALSCDGPNADTFAGCCGPEGFDRDCPRGDGNTFLRRGAELVVVVVSDGNDCSDASHVPSMASPICADATDEDGDGIPDIYAAVCGEEGGAAACFRQDCGDLSIADCAARCVIDRSTPADCEWQRDGLIRTDKLAYQLGELKRDRSQVAVWAFVAGERTTSTGASLRWDEGEPDAMCAPPLADEAVDACCPDGRCVGTPQTTCAPADGPAASGYRYVEVAYGAPHGCGPANGCDLCDGNGFAERLDTLPLMRHGACFEQRPPCVVPAGDRFRACETDAEKADPANSPLRVMTTCRDCDAAEPTPLPADAWRLEPGAKCDSGLFFRLLDPTAVPEGHVVWLNYGL